MKLYARFDFKSLLNMERNSLLSAILAITLVTPLLSSSSAWAINNRNNNQQKPGTTYLQRPDTNGRPQLMVAIYCGGGSTNSGKSSPASHSISLYHNQYLEIESRKWRTDRDPTAYCTQDKQEVLNYCRKVYPNHDIRNIVESSRPYKLDNWCKLGPSTRKCRTRLIVKPYRCLEGTFQSDALLVPERCLFDHVHNKSVCESSDHWNKTATENCQVKEMKLQSFAMLQPCGLSVFSGVEFVCCPSQSQQQQSQLQQQPDPSSEINKKDSSSSIAKAAVGLDEDKSNNIKVDEEITKKQQHPSNNDKDQDQEDSTTSENGGEDEEDDEYDDDEDEYDDDSSVDKSSSPSASSSGSLATAPSTTSTTTTTTTTTTERPIDHYLSHFDLAHERDEFRRAEMAVESIYREKITHVMKEWGQLDSRYEEMKKKDPQAAEEFKKKMSHQFQKTIEALEEEGAAQRHQLASMHAERAMAIINRRKKAAMDCLTQALDRIPIRTRQVEKCIVKLLKALEKDRTHTLRQYKNLLNLNTREALREKKIILDHLVTLNRAANQSITMLDRSPILVEKLKSKIVDLWHRLRNTPLGEPIVRESELKIMEKYEEEVAQRKIERERLRLMEQGAVQDTPQESRSSFESSPSSVKLSSSEVSKELLSSKQTSNINDEADSNSANSVKSILSSPGAKENRIQQQQQQSSTMITENSNKQEPDATVNNRQPQNLSVRQSTSNIGHEASSRSSIVQQAATNEAGHDESENEIHYQNESAKFSHLQADLLTHHELSYSVGHEQLAINNFRFGFSTLLVSACTIVVALALIGVKYYSKHSRRAYRRQGFAEVGHSCPEEKSVTNMQFNGYENPAYKYFEAEA